MGKDAPYSEPLIEKLSNSHLSAVHQTLRASRRRVALAVIVNYLLSRSNKDEISNPNYAGNSGKKATLTVRQLARKIVAIEEDIAPEHASGEEYHNVYTALCQTHLPRLDNVGAISFDSDRKNISPDENLVAMAAVSALTSPVASQLLRDAVTDLVSAGRMSALDSISD